ncbi:MAG: hypothetical protein RL685_426 [Pseudomonadota bacterium]|jgi:protein TonB
MTAALFTAVVWLFCLAIGVVGFVLPAPHPQARVPEPPPVVAEVVEVELDPPAPEPEAASEAPPPDPAGPPPLAQLAPPAPALVAVAPPNAQLAFAVPVTGPVRITDVQRAGRAPTSALMARPTRAPAPPVQTLTFGQGEGKQPAPEYPKQALREGQEGPVVVRFHVSEQGQVLSAELAQPSPWPLLNTAALRAVRQRWSFSSGRARLYEVSIRFELSK